MANEIESRSRNVLYYAELANRPKNYTLDLQHLLIPENRATVLNTRHLFGWVWAYPGVVHQTKYGDTILFLRLNTLPQQAPPP